MKYLSILSKILILAIFLSCNNNDVQPVDKEIQNRIDELVNENNIPGLNFSIIFENGEQENYSSGYADTLNKVELNSNHILFSGSIGKTYAAAIFMQLVDAGEVNLEDKYLDHFPEVEWLNNVPNIDDITIEMLLQHTSGLPRYINDDAVWDSLIANPDKVWTYEERLSYTYNMEPVHEAGKGWSYSDTNYLLIGMLIEELTQTDYYDEVEERILGPENLDNTHPAIRRDIPNLAVGYSDFDVFQGMQMVVDGNYIFNPQMEWTGGGMASSTPDLVRWAEIYYSGELFSETLKNIIITPNSNGINIDEGLSYGMGSFIYETKYGKACGHTGFMPGYKSIFAYFPEQDYALALQINSDYAGKDLSLVEYVVEILDML